MDKVLFIDNGKITMNGSHKALLKQMNDIDSFIA
jgi:ABC-type multidrug transport system fused ATPase/permease subunit